ncbi:hypothetical protein chiPu_0001334 [Chiloscyllium punctatum]|uniref:Uncharacterized protein n=1 Tax=Chiloscyllium punctatum TaxID=137246 RepID=A0A401RXS7_CHIPU|nr:hypothetical protein [Chiloscyllium punctatum]
MNLLYCSSGQTQIPFRFSSKMWTPLGLFLYISISSLTASSVYNLQSNGVKVLKSLHVSSAKECNQTCGSVADQDGLECNWVVIEEKQNLCFYLHCLNIPVCKRVTVEDAKALQIGQGLPSKIFLSRIRRDKREEIQHRTFVTNDCKLQAEPDLMAAVTIKIHLAKISVTTNN